MSLDNRHFTEADTTTAQSPRPPPDDAALPSTTVIITSFNYGHFLRVCIDSVLNQTRPADQIIIVDDGSTDASRDILAEYQNGPEIILRENGGQAAAFNEGFARATGDVVFFLDADDLLHPHALQTVLDFWNRQVSLMSFGLEMIDADGRSIGTHPFSLNANDGDNRPRLLRSGAISGPFAFAPTSGNAFNREFLKSCLPMNEENWRICSDALLVRAAALHGRIGAIPRVLGSYRIHGGNNYSRSDSFDSWSTRRGLRDMDTSASALETLATDPLTLHRDPDRDALKLMLLLRALEIRANITIWTRDFATYRAQARSALATILTGESPLRQRFAAAIGILHAVIATHRKPPIDPTYEPGADTITCRPAFLFGRDGARSFDRLMRPRFTEVLPRNTDCLFDQRGIHQNTLAEGWSASTIDGCCTSLGPRAALKFALDPGPGPIDFTLSLSPHHHDHPLHFEIRSDGKTLWRGPEEACHDIRFALDRDPWEPQQKIRLEISCTEIPPPWHHRLKRRRPPSFNLWKFHAATRSDNEAWPLIPAGHQAPMGDIVGADPASKGWSATPKGGASMTGDTAILRLTLPPGPRRYDVELIIDRNSPSEWLQVSCGDQNLFTGQATPGTAIRLPLPRNGEDTATRFALNLSLSNPNIDRPFTVSRIGLVAKTAATMSPAAAHLTGYGAPRFTPGQVLHIADNLTAPRFLPRGWDAIEGAGIRNTDAEAEIAFSLPPGTRKPALRLTLRPVLPPTPARRHVIGISRDGDMLQSAELLGAGEITVPLPEDATDITLTIHSVLTPREDATAAEITPAVFELTALALDGTAAPLPLTPAQPRGTDRPSVLDLLARVTTLASSDPGGTMDDRLDLRARLASALWQSDTRVLEGIATHPTALADLERFSAAISAAPLTDPEHALVSAMHATWADAPTPQNRLRIFLTSLLLIPAFKCPVLPDLASTPALLLRRAETVAAWLGREPDFFHAGEAAPYIRYLETLFEQIDTLLAQERAGTALHDFAAEILMGLHNTKALFGNGNLHRMIRLRSRCIERLLTLSGATLAHPRTPRPNACKLRIGVFIRSLSPNPETWSAKAMYHGLDRSRFEPVLILQNDAEDAVDTGDIFAQTIILNDHSVEAAVAQIRALDIDLFILGAYIANWETVTSIVAHRLARLQITTCFNCPTTLGFSSFDHIVAWQGTESPEIQAQYTEPMAWIAEPLQCCFDFSDIPKPDEPPELVRTGLGLPDTATLLTSGAMIHKIQPDLMDAWARILAASPDSQLILYPFAQVWAMSCAPDLFRRALNARLAEHGVSFDRVTILPRQTPLEIRRILAASNIYLDSFPYSGATTVCEAYDCNCIVVALSGETLRERTGAAWLLEYRTPELIARTADDYVDIATRLARDPDFRATMRARISDTLASGPAPHADFTRFGAAYSDTLWSLADTCGLFPGLGTQPPDTSDPTWPEFRSAPPPKRRKTGASTTQQRLVVMGLARTGSTLLCEIISRGKDTLIDHELFHHEEIQLRSGVLRDPTALALRDADPVPWLENNIANGLALGYRIVGFKLFPHHDPRVIDHVLDSDSRFVMVIRENMLAQYSSFRLAERTHRWVRHPSEERTGDRLDFDPPDFEAFERSMLRYRDAFLTPLSRRGHQALILDYPSLTHPATCTRLSEFLGHEIPHRDTPEILKQNTSHIADRFSNPDDVFRYLETRDLTRWGGDEMNTQPD